MVLYVQYPVSGSPYTYKIAKLGAPRLVLYPLARMRRRWTRTSRRQETKRRAEARKSGKLHSSFPVRAPSVRIYSWWWYCSSSSSTVPTDRRRRMWYARGGTSDMVSRRVIIEYSRRTTLSAFCLWSESSTVSQVDPPLISPSHMTYQFPCCFVIAQAHQPCELSWVAIPTFASYYYQQVVPRLDGGRTGLMVNHGTYGTCLSLRGPDAGWLCEGQ